MGTPSLDWKRDDDDWRRRRHDHDHDCGRRGEERRHGDRW
jgi:hypothetical protein